MKKALLLITLGGTIGLAQAQRPTVAKNSVLTEVTFEQSKAIDPFSVNHTQLQPSESKTSLGKFRPDVYDFVQIGNSFYDLQTNAAIGNRAILHSDGTITMAWTFSGATSTTFPDRGSGINHNDGTNWGPFPTVRTEGSEVVGGIRTGWPSIGMLANGNIYTIAHDAADGGLIMSTNTGKGKTDWTSASPMLKYSGGKPIWNRTANSGDNMYVLTNFSGQEGEADVIINKITNPTTFSRSTDGGKTWVDKHILLPGYDSSRRLVGGGDTYAITAKDSFVAAVIGGIGNDVTLFKSSDYGKTWTTIIVDSFKYAPYSWGLKYIAASEEVLCNDGSVDVLIDNNNKVHVTFGLTGIIDEDTTDGARLSLARSYNLAHWSEVTNKVQSCGTPIDMDGALSPEGLPWDITAETTANLVDGQTLPSTVSYAARYGNTGICSHPSMGVDASNRVFVTYDAPVEMYYHDYNANFRDIHIVYTEDGGESWSSPQNATQLRYSEAVFACQTKQVNDYVHFVFQEDIHPGTNLQNNGNTGLHPNVEQKIQYSAIPVQDILDGKLGQHTSGAILLNYDAKVFVVSQNYPNPFTTSTNVIIYMRAGADLSYTVTDATGKVVSSQNLGYQGAGNHEITIDGTNLTSGIYFYTLRTKDSEVTRKMNVVN